MGEPGGSAGVVADLRHLADEYASHAGRLPGYGNAAANLRLVAVAIEQGRLDRVIGESWVTAARSILNPPTIHQCPICGDVHGAGVDP